MKFVWLLYYTTFFGSCKHLSRFFVILRLDFEIQAMIHSGDGFEKILFSPLCCLTRAPFTKPMLKQRTDYESIVSV